MGFLLCASLSDLCQNCFSYNFSVPSFALSFSIILYQLLGSAFPELYPIFLSNPSGLPSKYYFGSLPSQSAMHCLINFAESEFEQTPSPYKNGNLEQYLSCNQWNRLELFSAFTCVSHVFHCVQKIHFLHSQIFSFLNKSGKC